MIVCFLFYSFLNSLLLGTGQNLWGTRTGNIDREAKKNREAVTFFFEKIRGLDFFPKKLGGRRLFLLQYLKIPRKKIKSATLIQILFYPFHPKEYFSILFLG